MRLEFPELKTLELIECSKLKQLRIMAPKLKKLDVTNSHQVSTTDLNELESEHPRSQPVQITGKPSITPAIPNHPPKKNGREDYDYFVNLILLSTTSGAGKTC